MNFSGERFIPESVADNELRIEHLQRYLTIKDLVKDKIVIDAACGEGYGTNIIAELAKKVYGIDISKEAIEHARKTYAKSEIEFIESSITSIPFEDNSIDVFISFETIEHVDEISQEKFISEIKRVLKEDGVLVISTPNKEIYSDLYEYINEFHVKEFYKNEFEKLIEKYFKFINLYSQRFEVSSIISNENTKVLDVIDYTIPKIDNTKYYIAVCSDIKQSKYVNIGSYVNEKDNNYIKLNKRIIQVQNEIEELSAWGISQDKEIISLNSIIDSLKAEVNNKNAQIYTLETELNNKKAHIELLLQSERELVNQVDNLKTELNNKNGHIELLLKSDRELENIKNSRAWRFISYARKIRDKILPVGSKRRLFVKIFVKFIKHPIDFINKLSYDRIKKFFYFLKHYGTSNLFERVNDCIPYRSDNKIKLNISDVNANESQTYKISDFELLVFPEVQNPVVSIIIPVYNQIHYTYSCLKSILQNTEDVAYEVIIANDCSTDITSEIDKFVKNVKLITNETNLRFLLNCNNAAEHAKGKYILFLNNDTQVQEKWLSSLVELIESDASIGMVGSKLVFPDGRLQEAGGIIWKDGAGWNYGRLDEPEKSEYNYMKEVDYISGASIMIRSNLWHEIGGFDERYVPAYYEDSDLAFEVRKHGYKVMYQPQSVVVHFEGISNGIDLSSGQKAYQIKNREVFEQKWEKELTEQFKNGEKVFIARDRSKNKKHILVIDHYIPQYDKDAGSRTVFQYLKLFCDMDFQVKFIGDNFYKHEPYTSELEQMGIEILYGTYYHNHWKDWLIDNSKFIDYVFLNRPHISIKYIDEIKKYTNAKVYYYGMDLHYLREMREYEVTQNKELLPSIKYWKSIEYKLMERADISYTLSTVEIEEIKKENPNICCKLMPIYILDEKQAIPFDNNRRDIMFVGGFTHIPNIDAVTWFVEEIFPLVLRNFPEMRFYIIGSNPTEQILKLQSDSIIVTGYISDEELINYYKQCRLAVAPLRFGAGVKGKIIEAMYNQIPVLTTSVGGEGLPEIEKAIFIEDGADRFANRLIEIYSNQKSLEEKSNEGLQYVMNYYSRTAVINSLKEDFEFKHKKEVI